MSDEVGRLQSDYVAEEVVSDVELDVSGAISHEEARAEAPATLDEDESEEHECVCADGQAGGLPRAEAVDRVAQNDRRAESERLGPGKQDEARAEPQTVSLEIRKKRAEVAYVETPLFFPRPPRECGPTRRA